MGQSFDSVTEGQRSQVWQIALSVLCLGILAYGYFYSWNSSSDPAFLVGYNLPFGFIIFAVFYVIFGRKQGKKRAVLSFLAVYGSLIASGVIGYSQQKSNTVHSVAEIRKEFSSLASSITDSQGLPKLIENRIDTTPTTKGQMGEVERLMKTYMNQIVSQRNAYMLELKAIGWWRILDPTRLKDDKTLPESKAMVQKAKVIVVKYRQKTFALLNKCRNNINNLDIDERLKQKMRSGFDRGMVESKIQIDALWDYEAQSVSEFEKIFALLSAKRGKWIVQDGHILFTNEEDLATFNHHIALIQELTRKELAIQKNSIETVNRHLNKVKN